MFKVGIDFDNTLVHYDELFYKLALEKNLISENVKKTKTDVRDFLRREGKDNEFTILQGEVYGSKIRQAIPAPKSIETIRCFIERGIQVFIISHKTEFPYLGKKYNLHQSARDWLTHYSFFQKNGANIPKDNVFFNITKADKIEKVKEIGCDFFIDDLPEILDLLPNEIHKIFYNPKSAFIKSNYDLNALNWGMIADFILKKL